MKVLIVDDVELNYLLLKAAISDLCEGGVLAAERATKAIEIAISERPDLVFMDLNLPDIDGMDAVALMKGNPILASIPVVIVSAHAQSEYIERAKRLGCDAYITKPISVAAVREVIKRLKGPGNDLQIALQQSVKYFSQSPSCPFSLARSLQF